MIERQGRSWIKYAVAAFVLVWLLTWYSSHAFGQTAVTQSQQTAGPAEDENAGSVSQDVSVPVMTGYKGITIGMTADEVKRVIGQEPENDDKATLVYVFSDDEVAQVAFDNEQKVRLIAVTYTGSEVDAPTYESVFGKSVPVKTNSGGGVYNMVRYPDAGYWVAYSSSTVENDPMVSVTIQRIRN
ncbi:MAG: hypothetical protein AB7F88_03965 [Pyrinomonadaceae bacterium]